jgi:FtsP/CotA-like multicopper oxidase with cupredoxin domain
MRRLFFACSFLLLTAALVVSQPALLAATIDDAADLATQQAQEKEELKDMGGELNDIKRTIMDAQQGMESVRSNVSRRAASQEIHLIAKEAQVEVAPGVTATTLTYNGQQPGPVIRLKEGDAYRIVLHNQLATNTSLCFHGMILPHSVAGLPRKDGGLVEPGATYAFSFVAPKAGTYWYHPQINHVDQMGRGLYGAIVVEPASSPKTYEHDFVLVLGQTQGPSKNPGQGRSTFFTINGKSAPSIPPIEVRAGERVRLRIVNAAATACPLYLSGHHFEVIAVNGADAFEPHVTRDTICLMPGDRYDVELTANNPGVWSLSSLLPSQTNNDGKMPGGMAMIFRYPEILK